MSTCSIPIPNPPLGRLGDPAYTFTPDGVYLGYFWFYWWDLVLTLCQGSVGHFSKRVLLINSKAVIGITKGFHTKRKECAFWDSMRLLAQSSYGEGWVVPAAVLRQIRITKLSLQTPDLSEHPLRSCQHSGAEMCCSVSHEIARQPTAKAS